MYHDRRIKIRSLQLCSRLIPSLAMAVGDIRTHEITFCSRVSKWADNLFSQNPSWNFVRTEIEESVKRKRSDLRIYGSNNRLALAGEVKLPGTAEGRSAFNSDLI